MSALSLPPLLPRLVWETEEIWWLWLWEHDSLNLLSHYSWGQSQPLSPESRICLALGETSLPHDWKTAAMQTLEHAVYFRIFLFFWLPSFSHGLDEQFSHFLLKIRQKSFSVFPRHSVPCDLPTVVTNRPCWILSPNLCSWAHMRHCSTCPLWSHFLYEPFLVILDQTEAPRLYGPWAYPTWLKQPGMRNKEKHALRKISSHVHGCLLALVGKDGP